MPCLCAWTGTAGGRVGAPQVRSRCEHVLHEFLALLSALGFKVDEVGCELASAPPCMLACFLPSLLACSRAASAGLGPRLSADMSKQSRVSAGRTGPRRRRAQGLCG